MNSKLSLVVVVAFAVAGCQSPKHVTTTEDNKPLYQPKKEGKQEITPIKKEKQLLRYFTKSSSQRITLDVKTDGKTSFDEVKRAIEGGIANSGFEISSENPFIVLSLKNKIKKYDKFGNYYIYSGMTEISAKRSSTDKGLIARTIVSTKGSRKLGQDEAVLSLYNAISKDAVTWVNDLCKREMKGLAATSIKLDMAIFKDVFTNSQVKLNSGIESFLKQVAKINGVMSCNLISKDNEKILIDLVYRKKNFPNGIVYGTIEFNEKDKPKNVNELIKAIIK